MYMQVNPASIMKGDLLLGNGMLSGYLFVPPLPKAALHVKQPEDNLEVI